MRVLESLKEVWGKEALSMALLVEVDRLPMMTWLGNKLRELKIEFRIHVSDAKWEVALVSMYHGCDSGGPPIFKTSSWGKRLACGGGKAVGHGAAAGGGVEDGA